MSGRTDDELLTAVYERLRGMAERHLGGERADHTLQPTALVNEAWLKVAAASGSVHDRAHFLALSARAMRSVLVDHDRRRRAQKRGGAAQRTPLDVLAVTIEDRAVDLAALDEALDALEAAEEHLARIVELRFFAGLEPSEIAAVVGRSERSVRRDWEAARHWLRQRIDPGER